MKRVMFLTNVASPYRTRFFETLGMWMDVTVLLTESNESQTHRSADWFENGGSCFHKVMLSGRGLTAGGEKLRPDVISWLKKPFDAIVICGYSNPTAILAMLWLRMHRRPFFIEVDGGLIREDSPMKYRIKKWLISGASGWLSSGKQTSRYLMHYGAREEAIREYPFTSLFASDLREQVLPREEKLAIRQELGIPEAHMVLAVGQFIHRKGFDVLLKAAAELPQDVGVYFVGGLPTEEYLSMQKELGLTHVHFVGFQKKDELRRYYDAADLFVLPTREDIWGLVVNEAMACGLPVITTDGCVAGLELVEDGVNGRLVPVGDEKQLAKAIRQTLQEDCSRMGQASLEKIRPYTIENMAKRHLEILG